MATAKSILTKSLRLIQVKAFNETPSGSEGVDGLEALNDLLDSYTNSDLMQFFRPEHNIALVSGQRTYTIGIGGDINVTRPVSIENAFTRDTDNSDWPITEINNDEYQRIVLKDTESTYPQWFFYKPKFPLADITLWPVPGSGLTMHINVRSELDTFSTLDTDLNFPPGYVKMLKYNLAVELAPEYKMAIPPDVHRIALKSMEDIQTTNDKNVPVLISPLTRRRRDRLDLWPRP